MAKQHFCMQCDLAFGLVERSEFESTCVDCLSKLEGPFIECYRCGRVMEKHEDLKEDAIGYKYCLCCADNLRREGHRTHWYERV